MEGRGPKGLLHENKPPGTLEDIRHRTRIMAINIGSLPCAKGILEQYINDVKIHVAAATETNVAPDKVSEVRRKNYSIANT